MFAPLINVLIIVGILYLARLGGLFGLFYELVTTALLLFATVLTLRYWYLLATFLQERQWMVGVYAVFGSYWILFLIGCAPLIVLARFLNEESRPLYSKTLDTVGGMVVGLAGAIILACAIFTSISVLGPALTSEYDRTMLWEPLDTASFDAYRFLEQQVAGVSETDPQHTRLPTFATTDPQATDQYWQ
jgi:hypothetical protein